MTKKRRAAGTIGRKRRFLGWTLLSLGALTAALWVWSGWACFSVTFDDWIVMLYKGELYGNQSSALAGVPTHWGYASGPFIEMIWRPDLHRLFSAMPGPGVIDYYIFSCSPAPTGSAYGTIFSLVIWPIPLLLWVCSAGLFWSSGLKARRRRREGKCAQCGYDLAGLAMSVNCPECGAANTRPQMNANQRTE